MIEAVSDRVWETDANLVITGVEGGRYRAGEAVVGKHIGEIYTDDPVWQQNVETLSARKPFRDR